MRWVVYGAGAVGGVVGARLHEAGHPVTLVARGGHLEAIRRDGLTVVAGGERRSVDVPAADSASGAGVDAETVVLLTVKSHQTAAAVEDLLSCPAPPRVVVSLQNGVANERTLLRWFPDVQAACVMMPTTHLEPGVVEQNSHPVPGILDVGRFPGGSDDTTRLVSTTLTSAGFVSEPREDIMAWKHRKLLGNLANAASACCRPGAETDELVRRVREEGARVLDAAGIPVVSTEEDRRRRGDLISTGTGSGGRSSGSSWQSLQRRSGSVESDYLNGEVVLLGRLHGVPAPANEILRRTALALAARRGEPQSVDAGELLAELS